MEQVIANTQLFVKCVVLQVDWSVNQTFEGGTYAFVCGLLLRWSSQDTKLLFPAMLLRAQDAVGEIPQDAEEMPFSSCRRLIFSSFFC